MTVYEIALFLAKYIDNGELKGDSEVMAIIPNGETELSIILKDNGRCTITFERTNKD